MTSRKVKWLGTGTWHVMARGAQQRQIFHDREDHETFLGFVDRYATEQALPVNVYALMWNHYHFMLTGRGEIISYAMARINWSYSRYYNNKYDHSGTLFEDSFISFPLFTPMRKLEVSCYIHQNPVTARKTVDAAEYEWSSFKYYFAAGVIDPPRWLDTGLVSDVLGAFGYTSKSDYVNLMSDYRGDDRDSWMAELIREYHRKADLRAVLPT